MKKIKFIIAAALVIVLCSATVLIDKPAAAVEQQNGINLFVYSKPVSKYDILGTVKIGGIVKSEKGSHMVQLLVDKAKKDYPSAEGIIVSSTFYNAEVIRFKE